MKALGRYDTTPVLWCSRCKTLCGGELPPLDQLRPMTSHDINPKWKSLN